MYDADKEDYLRPSQHIALHWIELDCSLSCLPVCLSVTTVHCGQTFGWIKMKIGMEVQDSAQATLC